MNTISENLSLFLIIVVLSVMAFVISFKVYIYIAEKYFSNEFTWFIQQTIFRSYFIFKLTVIGILVAYFLIAIYSFVLTPYWFYGLFILMCIAYLIFKISKSKKEGKLKFREDFAFQKYNTSVSFYNKQKEDYRRKCFESIIDKIKRTELNGITNTTYRNHLSENFLPKIDSLLTFEYYDSQLYNSISDHYTVTLFCRKYLKNLLEIISRIDKQTDNLSKLNKDYLTISNILLNIKLIKFDDNQGLHYDISLIDLEIEKHLNSDNKNFRLEKSLMVINQSLENLKLAFENNNFNSVFSEQTEILNSIKEKLNSITAGNKPLVYKLPESCTVKNISDALIDSFARKSTIQLLPKNISDLEKFVVKRFKNNSNKQSSVPTKDYTERKFFIENREEFYTAVTNVAYKFALEKKKLAEIILIEFPDIGHSLKTIENRL